MSYLRLKCTKFDFVWVSAPDPAGGSLYSAPPDFVTGFQGVLLLREGKGKEGKEKGRKEGGRLHVFSGDGRPCERWQKTSWFGWPVECHGCGRNYLSVPR